MPVLYPPANPTLSGDQLTISRFMNDPTLIARRLRTLAEQRFISDVLLTGRYETTSGAFLVESNENMYTDRPPQAVAPGGEYPLTPISTGPASPVNTVKWGNDAEVTDEAISRQRMNPVNKALIKLVNQMVKTIDGISLSAIASAIIATGQTTSVSESWTAGTSTLNIFRDVAVAKARVRALNQGYEPDIVAVSDILFANVISDKQFSLLIGRETKDSPVYTGNFPVIDGMTWLPTPNLPVAQTALLVDSTVLGGMGSEDIGGPGYSSAGGVGIQAKTIRDDDNDQWRLRSRRITVPIVNEPNAAWLLQNVGA